MKKDKKIKLLYGLEAAAGGALKHLTYLVTHLDKEVFEVTVILSAKRPDTKRSEIEKMKQGGTRVIELAMERKFSPLKDLSALYKIVRHLSRNSYDIVHAHSSKAGFLFRVAAWLKGRASIVYTPHCFYFQSKTGPAKAFYQWVEQLLGRITAYLIVSNNEKEYALQYRIASPEKIMNINNAIDFGEYYPRGQSALIRKKLGIPDESIVIGSIGRLTEQKDLVTYIYTAREVIKECDHVVFLLVGEGELREVLQNLIHELQLEDKVLITGHYEEIGDVFPVIDIFVSTSLWEGMPYVILEAMWFKKPVVASNLGYKGLLYDKENAFLVKAGDHIGFAEIIKHLLKDEQLTKEIGEKGYVLVNKDFNFDSFIRQHENLYKRIATDQ